MTSGLARGELHWKAKALAERWIEEAGELGDLLTHDGQQRDRLRLIAAVGGEPITTDLGEEN